MMIDELRHEGAFTRCFECDCVIEKRDDARWVTATRKGRDVRYLACTECADGTDPALVDRVEKNPLVDDIMECDRMIMESKEVLNKQTRLKCDKICQILEEEGYSEGLIFYGIGGDKMVITGLNRDTRRGDVDVLAHPAKKDGTASKYNEDRIPWVDFIRLWRMQRPDPELYAKRTRERFLRKNEEFNKKILTDDLELE